MMPFIETPKIPCPCCKKIDIKVVQVMYGMAYYALCGSCGWHGEKINIETDISSAIKMYERKSIEENKRDNRYENKN